MLTNWAGNIAFTAGQLHSPTSVEQLQDLVARSARIRALGSGHSFNRIADTSGDLVSVASLPEVFSVDSAASTVTVSAGLRYGDIAGRLHQAGFALPSFASLPHISVAGAVATGTHGSGNTVGSLATDVASVTLVRADGELVEVSRKHQPEEFPGFVVGLGVLGVVTQLTLDVVPTFDVRQWVYDDLGFAELHDALDEVFASAYSVSLFTDWRRPAMKQVWLKQRCDHQHPESPPQRWLGARLAGSQRHMIPGMPERNTTEQLGVPGPWHARLPHFRMEFTPSSGQELQAEFFVPRERIGEALAAVGGVADRIGPLVQVSEVRTIAADDLWLSPCYGRDTAAIHFTWVPEPEPVGRAVAIVEEQLAPLSPRAHWGKLANVTSHDLAAQYPRYADFAALMQRQDPTGKLRNDLVDGWFPPR